MTTETTTDRYRIRHCHTCSANRRVYWRYDEDGGTYHCGVCDSSDISLTPKQSDRMDAKYGYGWDSGD